MTKRKKNDSPVRSDDLPVNQRMLYLVRDELKADILSHESRFDSIDKRFDAMDKRFDAMDKRFDEMEKRFESFEAKIESIMLKIASDIHKMKAEIHRGSLLKEEQRAENKYVMDQYELVNVRQTKLETRMDDYEQDMNQILNARKQEPNT